MHILILGSTGPTGCLLVKQALNEGHIVRAIVRDPDKLKLADERLEIHVADILDEQQLTKELQNQDVVLSALGSGHNLHSDIISRAMPVLIRSMHNTGIKRLIFLSSFGVGDTKKDSPLFGRIVFKLFLNKILKDKYIADELLRKSDLDYTLVYPTSLKNSPGKGKYRAGEKISLPFFPSISREDVAAFMLKQVTDTTWIRKTVEISD
jgi:putative NADH-flavin reductase